MRLGGWGVLLHGCDFDLLHESVGHAPPSTLSVAALKYSRTGFFMHVHACPQGSEVGPLPPK